MKKQVGTKKYVLLSLNCYNDLLSLKRSSAVNFEEQQQQQLPSQSEQAKIEILEAIPSSHSNSEAIAKLSVSSQLVNNNNNKDFPSYNATTTDQTSLPENKFLPDKAVDKVLDTLLASGMSSGKIERTKRILNILSQKNFTLDRESGIIQGKDNKKSSSNLLDFFIDIQSPNKKLTKDDLELISQLQLLPHLVANTFAKKIASNTPHGQGQHQVPPTTTSTPTWLSIF